MQADPGLKAPGFFKILTLKKDNSALSMLNPYMFVSRLHAYTTGTSEVEVADLVKVRGCARKAVEWVRTQTFADESGEGLGGGPLGAPLSAGRPGAAGGKGGGRRRNLAEWAVDETVLRERDLVLAHTLQQDTVERCKIDPRLESTTHPGCVSNF